MVRYSVPLSRTTPETFSRRGFKEGMRNHEDDGWAISYSQKSFMAQVSRMKLADSEASYEENRRKKSIYDDIE